ncbi:MAG: hypothetical protein EBR82_52725 [Caulobacteraceae bacterium]|nr:hypothetical protein [Caulobacteraceae bacterium]
MAPFPMSLDTYGLEFDSYKELFTDEAAHLLYLYLEFDKGINKAYEDLGYSKPSEKTKYDLFTDALYATNDKARKLQRKEDPNGFKEETIEFISPTRTELTEKIDSLNAKVEALVDYMANFVTIAKTGLTDLVD